MQQNAGYKAYLNDAHLLQMPDGLLLEGVELEGEVMRQAGLQRSPLRSQVRDVALQEAPALSVIEGV